MKKIAGVVVLGLIISASAGLIPSMIDGIASLFPKDFSTDDVATLEREIANEFRDKLSSDVGEVSEVQLIKKAPRELVGFVKIKAKALNDMVITQRCTANMAHDTGRVIWQCSP